MFKTLDPTDISIIPFKVHKSFTVTDTDSGSGVFGIEGTTGSLQNFNLGTAPSRSFTTSTAPYSQSFFKYPTYYSLRNQFYKNPVPYFSFGSNDTSKIKKSLGYKLNCISIPQNLFGEEIKPKSVTLTDNSTATTFTIKDDGYGNLYDNAFSSSFAAGTPNANNSGSQVGNIFYQHGLLIITDTGSYKNVGLLTGTNGFEIDFKSTQTIYEHQYECQIDEGEYNRSNNISLTIGYSGSYNIISGSTNVSNLFPPGGSPSSKRLDPSRNEINLQAFYSQSDGFKPEYNGKPGSDKYNEFTHQTLEADPFGTFRNPVFKSTKQLMVGNTVGKDIGTLYKGNWYTFSIYLKWSGSGDLQDNPGFEFDLANVGINGSKEGSYFTTVNGSTFTNHIINNISTEWKRFRITAYHNEDENYHAVQVGDWFDPGYFMWSCPQIEIGKVMTDFVNDPEPTPINLPSSSYETTLLGVVTHSTWAPYITTVGLYNDNYQLVAVGKLSRPIKNDPDISYKLIVRFDT